ncbi:MAG: hypothetical protein ABII74_10305 [Elusimicrobiota bacterium]
MKLGIRGKKLNSWIIISGTYLIFEQIMGQHLYSFRQGWQSEALARFLLSHFSFLGQPSTIADDVGSDFYCTLFRRELAGTNQSLVPTSSFLIQIKSNHDKINLSDKSQFLNQLELPFFVGVANRERMKLQIYSGRALQLIFTMKGIPNKLLVELDPPISDKIYYSINNSAEDDFTVKFPLIVEIQASDVEEQADQIFSILSDENFLIHQNIASRKMGELILRFSEDDVRIFAGPGSTRKFRQNFLYRLAEVFFNLSWISRSAPQLFLRTEFEIYAELWEKLRSTAPRALQDEINPIYESLRHNLPGD